MVDLPRAILVLIFSDLSMNSLLQAKRVCRAWLEVAQDPDLIPLFHAEATKRNPSLIIHCDYPLQNSLYHVPSEEGSPHHYSNKALRVVPPFLSNISDYRLMGSCNGLLSIIDALYYDSVHICNIFTGDYIRLPEFDPLQHVVAFGFGYHPVTREYKVVRVVYNCEHDHGDYGEPVHDAGCAEYSDVQIHTVGTDDSWRSLGPIGWTLDLRPSEALLNGALHWVTNRVVDPLVPFLRIISFDIAEERFKEIERPICGSLDTINFHLVTIRGCLSAVTFQNQELGIWVMQVYDEQGSWTKDYVISMTVDKLPADLSGGERSYFWLWEEWTASIAGFQVVCFLNNGDILMHYEEGDLLLYSPASDTFQKLALSGFPKWCSVITCHESLFSANALLGLHNNENPARRL